MAAPDCSRWRDACTAAAILCVDPPGIQGIALRSAAGPVRDHWLAQLSQLAPRRAPIVKIPLHVADGRLFGGLDLAATLKAGRPVCEAGILAKADGGIVVLSMAERLTASAAAKLTSVIDQHAVVLERDGFGKRIPTRFAVVALDEGIDFDERPPSGLRDRLALHLDLDGLPHAVTSEVGYSRSAVEGARAALEHVRVPEPMLVALCEAAAAFGIDSARAPLLALRVARAITALAGRTETIEEDAALAARLVFAPRATKTPCQEEEAAEADSPGAEQEERPAQSSAQQSQEEDSNTRTEDPQALSDRVVEAARAALSPEFLAYLNQLSSRSSQSRSSGRSAGEHGSLRGRPSGVRCGDPRRGSRISVIDTLRAAAPWQKLRRAVIEKAAGGKPGRAEAGDDCGGRQRDVVRRRNGSAGTKPEVTLHRPQLHVLKDDFRVVRFKRRNQLTTIFLVDASGSAALNRLAEAKGAVELMLADSYVRRDRVALISFRGNSAQMLLPPTTSLVRVKRELASLPGGGGTPLARGLDAARVLADSLHRRGESPFVIVLTDGRPNVARDGKGNRAQAEADAINAARMMRSSAIHSLMVDTAPQPRMLTEKVAHEMGARYVPLPYADAGALATVARQCGVDRSSGSSWRPHA